MRWFSDGSKKIKDFQITSIMKIPSRTAKVDLGHADRTECGCSCRENGINRKVFESYRFVSSA